MKLRALDLFCGDGGVTKGLKMAGFDYVVGVDHVPQPNYCGDEFICHDATRPPVDFREFHFVWASPVCHEFTTAGSIARAGGKVDDNQIPAIRYMLLRSGRPWVIENVPNAPLRADITLNGYDFGLPLLRRRIFETSSPWAWNPPRGQRPSPGAVRRGEATTVAGCLWQTTRGERAQKAEAERAMGIDWMTIPELTQAIPPAFSEWIGRRAIDHIGRLLDEAALHRLARLTA